MGKPKIRFKGYTDEWEQRKLGELAEIVGGGTPSTSVDSYWDGDIDWYAPAEIGEQIYLKSSQRKITEEGLNKSSAKVLPVGTVLFTSRAGIGKTAILLKEGCTNQGFQSIVPNKDKLDSYFIFTRSEELKRYGETVGAGSTFVEVSGKQMANMELMMPTIMDEQQKIGEYFSNLDHLITLHHRKYEETQKLKKYMLQKMFPQNGRKVPEIRFSGFTEEWEQRKVKDISDFIDGNYGEKYPRDDEFIDLGIPFFTSAVTGSEGIFNEKNIKFISTEKNRELTKAQSQGGDLILTNRGASMGVIAEIPEKYGLVNIGPQLTRIRGKENEANNKYLLCLFQTSTNNKKLTSMNAGSAMPFIGLKGLGNIDLLIPQYDEQLKIGEYFSCLDNLITLHQQKCDELRNVKKFMLQNMFI